jgi:cysteinyl-tRNA synthetase
MDNSYQINFDNNFISFAADQRDLNNIPVYPATIYNENTDDITIISQAKNFLYLINSENYATKNDFIIAVNSTNYDVVLMDLYHNEEEYTQTEIAGLKSKANGAARLVIAYMSIAEAEEYRYYWINSWRPWDPVWLEKENPEWEGNYKVRYWDCDWQNIIFGNDNSYLKKILDAGFDGAYLDIIDGFEYFEEEY